MFAAGGLTLGPAGCAFLPRPTGHFPAPGEIDPEELWARHPTPEVTPVEDFYILSNAIPPELDRGEWTCEVGGRVDRPMEIDFSDLTALAPARMACALECVGNPPGGLLIGSSWWRGPRLRDLLLEAGVRDGAREVVFKCEDGYHTSIPLEKALDPDTLLATEQNDEPLTVEHGFPVRLIAPGLHGYKNPKYIHTIQVVDYDYKGFYEKSGWSDEGDIDVTSRIDLGSPRDDQVLPRASDGSVLLSGTVLGGSRGVSRVAVKVAGHDWRDAVIKPGLGPYAWQLWALPWYPPGPGRYELTVRAWDASGRAQPSVRWFAFPAGASGLHSMHFRVEG